MKGSGTALEEDVPGRLHSPTILGHTLCQVVFFIFCLGCYDSTARRLNITNQKVTQLAAKGAGAGGGKAKK